MEYFNGKFDFDDTYNVSMNIFFDEEQNELTEIDGVLFDGSTEVELNYDDGYPYK